jgi:hypothetical protein
MGWPKTELFDDGGARRVLDTIPYKEKLWLVPRWIETQKPLGQRPERIVCLSPLRYERTREGVAAAYVLHDPVPKAVLEGHVPPELRDVYIVEMEPDIHVRSF